MNTDRAAILVTTDGSAHSRRILPHADAFARARGSRLLLAEVLNAEEALKGTSEGRNALLARATDQLLAELRRVLESAGINGEAVATVAKEEEGLFAEVIVRLAEEQGAGVIAMDTRGHGALHHALLGSVALDVLQRTVKPVMLSGPDLGTPPADGVPYRILATNDGSPASQDVLRALARELVPGRFSVTLLRVVERPASGVNEAVVLQEAEAHLRSLFPILPQGVEMAAKVREIARLGGVDTAIIEEAELLGANAIAMSTHGTSARRHLLAGSTALMLLGRSPLPVIMARARS
ncbi:MAG TPA: universal stress protein [Dehalococcoidia bacterium]|nr:universal stress protein [Dehalococcoidia bacterium]